MNLKELIETTKNISVLYVEDSEDIRYEFKKLLDIFFEHVDIACDGLEALERYKHNNANYDLVISDIVMPRMDGIDLSKAILEINVLQQIIIISTYDDAHELQVLRDMGVTNYIHKPVDMDILSQTLQNVVNIINNNL